jgi:hypothetical protein
VQTWPSSEPESAPQEQSTESTRETYETSRVALERSLRKARWQVAKASTAVLNRIRTFATERPLHFVAMIAGASFLAGVALRLWRSNRHA